MITRFPADELLVAGRRPTSAAPTSSTADARPRRAGSGLTTVHILIRREEIELGPALPDHSTGLDAVGADRRRTPARPTPASRSSRSPTATSTRHLHSFETSFYVFDGRADALSRRARGAAEAGRVRRDPGRSAARLAQRGRVRLARDDVATPARRPEQPPDTFFLGPPPDAEPLPLDLRDPRNRNLFLLSAGRHGHRPAEAGRARRQRRRCPRAWRPRRSPTAASR